MFIASIISQQVIVQSDNEDFINTLIQRGFGSKLFQDSKLVREELGRCKFEFNDVNLNENTSFKTLTDVHPFLPMNSVCGYFKKRARKLFNSSLIDNDDSHNGDESLMKNNPQKKRDFLVLRDTEAFFLVLNCQLKIVKDGNGNELNSAYTESELWKFFCDIDQSFPKKYKSFEYFRKRGFVVKSGSNFGTNFTIYRSTPTWSHSEMCVLVFDYLEEKKIPWLQIASQTRICQDVMKHLVICFVDSSSVDGKEWHSSLLSSITIRLVTIINRRHHTINEKYRTVEEMQKSYQSISILKNPRKNIISKKDNKSRVQDQIQLQRPKKLSKHNKLWNGLMKPAVINSTEASTNTQITSKSIAFPVQEQKLFLKKKKRTSDSLEVTEISSKKKKLTIEGKKLAIIESARQAVAAANAKIQNKSNLI